MTYTYEVRVRLPDGRHQDVRVQTGDPATARLVLEARYGKDCIQSGPHKVP